MAFNTAHAEFVTTVASEECIGSKGSRTYEFIRESTTTRPVKSD